MNRLMRGILAATVLGATPAALDAHFILLEPASWLQVDQRGDPQKLAPCGGTTANPGTPSNVVTSLQGGQTIRLRVQETIYHPGHYRVALSVTSRTELPPDPAVVTRDTPKGEWSVSAAIQDPPQVPVLADGLFPHNTRPTAPFEADIALPNINCEKCTLQVIQFMAEHGRNRDGDFSYHHCADLKITADASKPIDTRWPGQGQAQ